MKLNFSLLVAVIHAETDSSLAPDIRPYLDELQSYCEETYGLPAYRTGGNYTRTTFADKWKHRKILKLILIKNDLLFWKNYSIVFENGVSSISPVGKNI